MSKTFYSSIKDQQQELLVGGFADKADRALVRNGLRGTFKEKNGLRLLEVDDIVDSKIPLFLENEDNTPD